MLVNITLFIKQKCNLNIFLVIVSTEKLNSMLQC